MPPQYYRKITLHGITASLSVGLAIIGQSMLPILGTAFAADEVKTERENWGFRAWHHEELMTMELSEQPDIDFAVVESGNVKSTSSPIFKGQNVVSLWDGGPAKLRIAVPTSWEETILILKGELVLTDKDGNQGTYHAGDVIVVPAGFVGTWEMTEEYREIIVIDPGIFEPRE